MNEIINFIIVFFFFFSRQKPDTRSRSVLGGRRMGKETGSSVVKT